MLLKIGHFSEKKASFSMVYIEVAARFGFNRYCIGDSGSYEVLKVKECYKNQPLYNRGSISYAM